MAKMQKWVFLLVVCAGVLGCKSQSSPYEFRTVPYPDSGWEACRIDTASGEAWLADGGAWKKIGETGSIPKGTYEVQIHVNQKGLVLFRADRSSGKAWYLYDGVWNTVKEPAEED